MVESGMEGHVQISIFFKKEKKNKGKKSLEIPIPTPHDLRRREFGRSSGA
jgi:hypothetical protein